MSRAKHYRDKSQSMGLWLNETNLFQPERLDAAVADLAQSGYGIIRLILRNTNLSHRSPEVISAVGRLVNNAHARKMKVVLDCEPHAEPVAHDLGNLYPKAIGSRVVCRKASVHRGRFTTHIQTPDTAASRTDFSRVEAIFVQEGNDFRKLQKLPSLEYRVVVEPYLNGFTTAAHSYQEGRPGAYRNYLHLSGILPQMEEGNLMIYVRFFDPRVIDFWSEDTNAYFNQLLDGYKEIELDGISWDEPGIGGAWDNYLYGDCFAEAFERLNGYRLEDNWAWLDSKDCDAKGSRVRLDYYRTLNEGIYQAQRHLFSRARETFGENLLLGTHHTWQGEGGINDYRAGAVDYFRLNENMEAGYTDCWWWDAKSVCYAYTLGSSLGRLTPSGEAEINTWDAKPTNARVEFQARLMTMLDLTWFNIWYGDSTDTCLYPADYTWATTVREMNRHRDAVRYIGAAKPVVQMAILHGWETVCGINRADIASAHKTFCLNISELMVERSIPFDWIDTALLESSVIEGEILVNILGSYSLLVLPYASILPRGAWERCLEFAAAGGRIIFTGPPPEMDTAGRIIREEFAGLMGMKELPLSSFLNEIDAFYSLPKDRADRLDVHYELEADPLRVLISIEGRTNGLRNPAGNVIYFSDLDPGERLMQFIEPWLEPSVKVHSNSVLWRLYKDSDREMLICIARQERSLSGMVSWAEHQIELREGTIVVIEKIAGRLSIRGKTSEARLLA